MAEGCRHPDHSADGSSNLVVGETYSPPGLWSGTPSSPARQRKSERRGIRSRRDLLPSLQLGKKTQGSIRTLWRSTAHGWDEAYESLCHWGEEHLRHSRGFPSCGRFSGVRASLPLGIGWKRRRTDDERMFRSLPTLNRLSRSLRISSGKKPKRSFAGEVPQSLRTLFLYSRAKGPPIGHVEGERF